MEKGNYFSARRISYFAILLALVIVLQAFGGTINIGAVQLNFTLIPIVLGAIVLGPLAGALLGFACGVVVLVQVIMGVVPFYTLIWTNDPVVTALTCVVKTTVAGLVAGLLFNLIKKKNKHVAVFVAAGVVPVINTSLFIVGCLFMVNSVYGLASGQNILVYILVSLVTFNFFFEFSINLLLAPGIERVIRVFDKSHVQAENSMLEIVENTDTDKE